MLDDASSGAVNVSLPRSLGLQICAALLCDACVIIPGSGLIALVLLAVLLQFAG